MSLLYSTRMKSRTCKWLPVCPMKRFNERGLVADAVIDAYCRGAWESCKRYRLEEAGIYHPDNMLPDGTVDGGLG